MVAMGAGTVQASSVELKGEFSLLLLKTSNRVVVFIYLYVYLEKQRRLTIIDILLVPI